MNILLKKITQILIALTFFVGVLGVSAQETQTPANGSQEETTTEETLQVYVVWDWSATEIVNTNDTSYVRFKSDGPVIPTGAGEINLIIYAQEGNETYFACSFDNTEGAGFMVSYPACVTGSQDIPQTGFSFEPGKVYHVFFYDAQGNFINDASGGGTGIYELPVIPVPENEEPGEEVEPEEETTTTDPSNNPPSDTSTGGLFSQTQLDLLEGGIVPDCGYDIQTQSNREGTGHACGISDAITLIQNIIEYILILILPIAAIVFAYVGFLFLTSGGDTGKRDKAKKAMGSLVVGIIVILAAWLLVKSILSALGVDTSIANQFLDF